MGVEGETAAEAAPVLETYFDFFVDSLLPEAFFAGGSSSGLT